MFDNHAISTQSLEKHYGINGSKLQRQYKKCLSNFDNWTQKIHAENYVLYPENIGEYLSLDETALSNGELYTVLTNKLRKGRKRSIVAMVKGTKVEDVSWVLKRISRSKREKVKEITLDMASSMNQISRVCFPRASRVTDRFHVQKLVFEAVQEIRIKHRWETLDQENSAIQRSRKKGNQYHPKVFDNGDTRKQLLARSRYLLFKSPSKWTVSQTKRAALLFIEYPDLEQAYLLAMDLVYIYEKRVDKKVAFTKLAQWFDKIEKSQIKSVSTIRRTFEIHYRSILNFFDNRSTNASAESFNAKIKEFRRAFRGVRDIKFFLFRLTKIYA